jgi:RND family efflux transporter MFP subunit
MDATLDVSEIPGRNFKGKVARIANSLDPSTRTMLIEADIENPDLTLTPGLYATVHFLIPRPGPIIMVPSSALIFDQRGMQVAVFENGEAHVRKVGIGQDDGAQVQITTGLNAGQEIILNPPAGLQDGAKVKKAQRLRPTREVNPRVKPGCGSGNRLLKTNIALTAMVRDGP